MKHRKFWGLFSVLAGIAGILGAWTVLISGGSYPLWIQLAYAIWVAVGFIFWGVYMIRSDPK